MTFLTIDEINSNPKHAPIPNPIDAIYFKQRIKDEIIKTFYGLSIHRPINEKTIPNLYYRKVILKMTNQFTRSSDKDMEFPQKGSIMPTCDDEGQGERADWNEDLMGGGGKKANREDIKKNIDFTKIQDYSNQPYLVRFMWDTDCLNPHEPCPKWYL